MIWRDLEAFLHVIQAKKKVQSVMQTFFFGPFFLYDDIRLKFYPPISSSATIRSANEMFD